MAASPNSEHAMARTHYVRSNIALPEIIFSSAHRWTAPALGLPSLVHRAFFVRAYVKIGRLSHTAGVCAHLR